MHGEGVIVSNGIYISNLIISITTWGKQHNHLIGFLIGFSGYSKKSSVYWLNQDFTDLKKYSEYSVIYWFNQNFAGLMKISEKNFFMTLL